MLHRSWYDYQLRHDNADRRLTPLGRRSGLVNDVDWARYGAGRRDRQTQRLLRRRHDADSLEKHLKRTETEWEQIATWCPEAREFPAGVIEQVILEAKYAGYIDRQTAQVERFQRLESKSIPATFDYLAVPQLRNEAKEKLTRIRPGSVGQAGRISGITPADLAVLLIYLE